MTNVAGRFALALHGGAGTLWRGEMTAEREAAYGVGLLRALAAGRDVLAAAGNAVTVTVCALDDDPLFNAGGGCMPVPWPAATLGRGDRPWPIDDFHHIARGASSTRKLPAFTNFARPTGIARAKRPHNSYNAIVLHVCHEQGAQKSQ